MPALLLKENPYEKNSCYAAPVIPEDSYIEIAALKVANSVHDKDIRKKDLPEDMAPLKGLTHQYLTYRLLKAVGASPEICATGLVHDVIEDHSFWNEQDVPFERREHDLKWHLIRAMPAHGRFNPQMESTRIPVNIQTATDNIARRTLHLSNPESMPEGKRIYQADKVNPHNPDALDPDECLVKLADQAASVICDIITPAKKKDKGLTYAAKGWSIGQACAKKTDGDFISDQHEWLFNVIKLATEKLNIIASMDDGEANVERGYFTLDALNELLSQANSMVGQNSRPRPHAAYSIVNKNPLGKIGILGVNFTKTHEVIGFQIRCAPGKNKENAVNQPVGKLIGAIESDPSQHNIVVEISLPEDNIRTLRLARPMRWNLFYDKAAKSGAFPDMEYVAALLAERGQRLHQKAAR